MSCVCFALGLGRFGGWRGCLVFQLCYRRGWRIVAGVGVCYVCCWLCVVLVTWWDVLQLYCGLLTCELAVSCGIFLCIFGLAVVLLGVCGFGLRSGCGFEFGCGIWFVAVLVLFWVYGICWLGLLVGCWVLWILFLAAGNSFGFGLLWLRVFVLLICLTCVLRFWCLLNGLCLVSGDC